MSFNSMDEILTLCRSRNISFAQAVLEDDLAQRGTTKEQSRQEMKRLWEAMLSAEKNYDPGLRSTSRMTGGAGGLMEEYVRTEKHLSGDFIGQVITLALKMGESNACMKRIVAAPTAGACGVLPAVLIPYYWSCHVSEDAVLDALYTAAGIGQIIASRASIAGASGGCQAEIGSASSMAAGALVSLQKGSPEQIAHASAMALKNLLGLVCDPVAGLVEVPCVKRNTIGAVNAITCADMAMAGIESVIPADQVFDAMREVGDLLPSSLKETGKGGLAATPEGIRISKELYGS